MKNLSMLWAGSLQRPTAFQAASLALYTHIFGSQISGKNTSVYNHIYIYSSLLSWGTYSYWFLQRSEERAYKRMGMGVCSSVWLSRCCQAFIRLPTDRLIGYHVVVATPVRTAVWLSVAFDCRLYTFWGSQCAVSCMSRWLNSLCLCSVCVRVIACFCFDILHQRLLCWIRAVFLANFSQLPLAAWF